MAALTWTAKHTLYQEDAFIENYDNLAVDEDLRERVANGITDQLMVISDVAIEGRLDQLGSLEDLGIDPEGIEESDPTEFADAVRKKQRSVILSAANAVVSEAQFADLFSSALKDTHVDLLDALADDSEIITSDTGEVSMNFGSLFADVQDRIADEPVTQPVSQVDVRTVARDFGDFKVLDKTAAFDWIWNLFRNAEDRTNQLIGLSIVSLVLAVVVSDRRPWVLITFGTAMAALAVVVVVVAYVAWALVPLLVDESDTSGLVATVYRRTISPFVSTEITVAAAGVGMAILGSIARWIWPDDWVYEHHDNGSGPMAVQTAYPTQQVFPQYQQQRPQQGYLPQGYPQQAPQPQFRPVPASPEPFSRSAPAQPALPAAPAEPAPAPETAAAPPAPDAAPAEADGWDYDGDW